MLYHDITIEEFAEIRAEEQYQQGLSEGREQGLSEGQQLGSSRVNQLNQLLSEAGRIEDMIKASKDPQFQAELFKEFHL